MVPVPSNVRRRAVLATTGASLSGLAGCGYFGDTTSDRPPLWGESIRVGVLATSKRQHGESITNGARMIAERINADGGVAGAELELVEAATEADPDDVREEHRRLCEEANCDLTLGLFLGSSSLGILESVTEQETVHLTTGSLDGRTGGRIADEYDAYRYYFRPGLPNYRDLADAQLEFLEANADDLDWERAALIVENLDEMSPYWERLDARLDEVLAVPISQRPGGVGDWAPLYDDVEAEDSDVVIVGMALGGTTAVEQWARQQRDFAFGGLDLMAMAPDYWEETDGDVEYTFTLDGLTPESDNTSRTRDFVADYAERFGSAPVYSAATTYDSLKLYRQALENIVRGDDAELPEQDALVEALEAITFTDGLLYDEFEFTGPDADLVHEPVWESVTASTVPVVQQWQANEDDGGSRTPIAPTENRTAAYQTPPWLS